MSIRLKLITTLTAILVVTFISLSFYNYNAASQNAREETIKSALPLTRDNIYSEIQAGLMRPLFVSSLMANDTFLKDWAVYGEKDVIQVMRYLKEIQDKYGFFSTFFVSALTKDYYYPQGILKTVSKKDDHDVWFYDFVRSGKTSDLVVDTNEAYANVLTIFINHRVEDRNGKLLGVTGVGLKMDKVSSLLKEFSEKYGKTIFMVDKSGIVQAHHQINLISDENIRMIPGLQDIADDLLAVDRAEPATYACNIDGETTYLTTRYIPELEWFLVVEQNESAILVSARKNFVRTLAIGAALTLFIVILSVLVVNHFQTRLERQANTDSLTGVLNRRAFERKIMEAIRIYSKCGRPFSLLLLDVDGFKRINDQCGHVEGDIVLRKVSEMISSSMRKSDCCARWGGDEFIVLVQGDSAQAAVIAERVRERVEGMDYCSTGQTEGRSQVKVTVSCGLAPYKNGDSLDSLTLRADRALYQSKADGKNRVSIV